MTFRRILRRWTETPTATAVPSATAPTFADETGERLRALERERQEADMRLTVNRPAWDRLKSRDDAAAHQERESLAPLIIEDEALIGNLDRRIAEVKGTIKLSAQKAAAYATFVGETTAWLTPMLERLPTEDELERAFRASRQLDREAHELLTRTGDRQFRRPLVDPYRTLREALEDRLRTIERLRLMRAVLNKTAS